MTDIDQYMEENMNFAMSRLEYEEGEEAVEIKGVINPPSEPTLEGEGWIIDESTAKALQDYYSNMRFQVGGPSHSPHVMDVRQYYIAPFGEPHIHQQQKQSNETQYKIGMYFLALSQRFKAWWGRVWR